MITFLISIVALFIGYTLYGRVAERVFGPDDRETPAIRRADKIDYIVLPGWRIFMIQFLNIAGTGPIFGAIMGAWFGPSAYLWIVFGCIFGGAVHDYISGMISMRHDGMGQAELTGLYLGATARKCMVIFTMMMMVLVGAFFVYCPAIILAGIWGEKMMWVGIIFVYYIATTVMPIDKLIGRVYPLFALSMLFMVVALGIVLVIKQPVLPELWDGISNLGAERLGLKQSIFPALFVTIACGAVSGFHATQSPMMARCMKSEHQGRPIFYGAMVTEGIVALVWATISNYFFFSEGWRSACSPETIAQFEASGLSLIQFFDAPTVVNIICYSWLGTFGSILALLGIVAAPITTGGSSFRTARLILSEAFGLKQTSARSRLLLSLPVFAVGIALLAWQIGNPSGFGTVWQYVAWGTQAMAAVTLWFCTVYLTQKHRCYWLTLIPGIFMTMVVVDFLLISPTTFHLPAVPSHVIAAATTLASIARFIWWKRKFDKKECMLQNKENTKS
ncbi:MAG: carbon starvation protein A [Bacteroidales bacterium]|nr:carbon starvation protein A [Bacteroidales bacterium]